MYEELLELITVCKKFFVMPYKTPIEEFKIYWLTEFYRSFEVVFKRE